MSASCWQGEAPGRLDVLGGVADYSGSLVLQMPIRAMTRVTITPLAMPRLELRSIQEGTAEFYLREPQPLIGSADPIKSIGTWLAERTVPQWVRYPLGCFLLFCQAQDWWPEQGLSLTITSEVPTSMGVSSSAALEVATLRALEAASGRRFQGTELARLAQRAENDIVGAPCGLMDQLAAAHGKPGALLPILCRPDFLDDLTPLPEKVTVVGWPSGVKHAVSASPYATARTAAFMGKKILETVVAGRRLAYVTELAPSQVRAMAEELLPAAMSGKAFLAKYSGLDDPLSKVQPDRSYPVRAAVSFPIEEHFRAGLAVQMLRDIVQGNRRARLEAIGELMYQSHAGYSSMGLGCPETDAMVDAVRQVGSEGGFYGARVSGGGSGGTVVVFLEERALPKLKELAEILSPDKTRLTPLIA
jgi:galactokinase